MIKLMRIPKSKTFNINKENLSKMEKITEEFFNNIEEYLRSKYKNKAHKFELKKASSKEIFHSKRKERTIKYIFYDKEIILGGIISDEIQPNNLRYTFFRNLNHLKKY